MDLDYEQGGQESHGALYCIQEIFHIYLFITGFNLQSILCVTGNFKFCGFWIFIHAMPPLVYGPTGGQCNAYTKSDRWEFFTVGSQ